MPVILLSPAKTMDMSPLEGGAPETSTPGMLEDMAVILAEMQKKSPGDLKALFSASDDIAKLNHARYQGWDELGEKAAAFAFDGPAYRSLDAPSLDAEALRRCQEGLLILCGLYGVVRPLDAIKPYRLEMGNKLGNPRGDTLYDFWKPTITEHINSLLDAAPEGERFVVNCASQEYFKVVDQKALKYPLYTMVFPGPAVHAKGARGAMVRFICENGITDPEGLKAFKGRVGEYTFNKAGSSASDLVFQRNAAIADAAKKKPTPKRKKPAAKDEATPKRGRKTKAKADEPEEAAPKRRSARARAAKK